MEENEMNGKPEMNEMNGEPASEEMNGEPEMTWKEIRWKRAAPWLLGCLTVSLLLLGLVFFLVWRGCSNGEEDTTPPVITKVATSVVSYHSANITWTTDEKANSQVEYGTTTAYGTITTINPHEKLSTAHYVTLTKLADGTEYHYRVISRDKEGNKAISEDYTFTTKPDPVVEFPDYNLNLVIRGAAGVLEGDIHASDLMEIPEIDARDSNIADLSGLEYCINLTVLNLNNNYISDVSPLSGLTNLYLLSLQNNRIVDIMPLANNLGLGEGDIISLNGNPLDDQSKLLGITALKGRGATVYS